MRAKRRGLIVRTLWATALPAGLLAGCASGLPVSGGSDSTGTFVQAADAKPIAITDAQLTRAEQGSEAFGLALLQKLGADGKSMVYSPQTLVDLLGMLLPGAQGETRTALLKALGVTGTAADTAAAAFGKVDATGRADANQDSNTLDEASDLWAANGLKPTKQYLDALYGAFRTGVHQADFQHDPNSAQDAIDNLVAQETHGYIQQLFPKGSIDASTVMVLTDAVYLNASWENAFDPEKTSDEDFFPSAGTAQQTPMMDDGGTYAYAAGSGWQMVELPYKGGKLAMDVLLPSKGTEGADTLAALRNGLTADSLNAMLKALTPQRVEVRLPKFTTDSTADSLMQDLSALGLGGLFQHADLSGMFTGGDQAYISAVVEKAHIQVGEKGTVAAAAAGGAVGTSAAAPAPIAVTADHPFLYLVRDLSTGQLLFAGQLTAPGA